MPNLRSKLQSAIRPGRKASSPDKSETGNESSPLSPAAAGTTRELPIRPATGKAKSSSSASTTPPHLALATLPSELLHKIAATCAVDDILRLRRSSRVLTDACDDPLVMEGSLRRHMPAFATKGTPGRDAFLDMLRDQLGDDQGRASRITWLSLAVAVQRRAETRSEVGPLLAQALTAEEDGAGPDADADVTRELEGKIGTMSTLLVIGYPDASDLKVGLSLTSINSWALKQRIWPENKLLDDKQLNLQLAFCMLMGILHPQSDWSGVPRETPDLKELTSRVKRDFHRERLNASNQAFTMSWEGLQTRSLQLAAVITYILRQIGHEDLPRSDLLPLLSTSPGIWIPLLEKGRGDYTSTSSASWQKWYTSRVQNLVDAIEDDEWYGYYVYALEGFSDAPMEGVHFKLGHPKTGSVSHSLEALGGHDGVTREFNFSGSVNRMTGSIRLQKNYPGFHYWDYDGVMTPVGIIGEWGRQEMAHGYSGYFWLWKRSWMDPALGGEKFVYA